MPANIDLIVMPSLSEDGWVFSSLQQADRLMACFLASNYSQSYLYWQDISSFAKIIATNNNNTSALCDELTKVLSTLFNRYFNGVQVECTDRTDPASPSKAIVAIYVGFSTADGSSSNIARLVQIKDSKFKLINDVINNGG